MTLIEMIFNVLRKDSTIKYTAKELAIKIVKTYPTEFINEEQNVEFSNENDFLSNVAMQIRKNKTNLLKLKGIKLDNKHKPQLYFYINDYDLENTIIENNQSKNEEFSEKKNLKENRINFLGIVTLVITLIYGGWGIYLASIQNELSEKQMELSLKQDSTSLDLLHFSELLRKTDSVIIITKDQLLINKEVQERANINYVNSEIGNMNRLLDKTIKINNKHLELFRRYNNFKASEGSIKKAIIDFENLNNLFIEEMNNPYLNSNDTIIELWSHAYGVLGSLILQLENSLIFVGDKSYNPVTHEVGIIELDAVGIESLFQKMHGDVFTSIGALGYIYVKINNEKIKRGILDKNGKSKINPIDFYIHSD